MLSLKRAAATAAVLVAIGLTGCAAAVGTVAGDMIGGAGWAAMKTGKVAVKGGALAARTTGRTVRGAARGVHDEFSPKDGASPQDDDAKPSDRAQSRTAVSDLRNRPKVEEDAVGGLSERQGASLAD